MGFRSCGLKRVEFTSFVVKLRGWGRKGHTEADTSSSRNRFLSQCYHPDMIFRNRFSNVTRNVSGPLTKCYLENSKCKSFSLVLLWSCVKDSPKKTRLKSKPLVLCHPPFVTYTVQQLGSSTFYRQGIIFCLNSIPFRHVSRCCAVDLSIAEMFCDIRYYGPCWY